MQQRIKKPHAKVREEKKRGVEFPGHKKVKVVIHRHPATVYKYQMASCLPCQNGTAKNPQIRWRCQGTGALPPEPVAHPLGIPSAPPGGTDGDESYETEGMLSMCVYIHSPLPNSDFVNYNAYAKGSEYGKHFIPDLLSTLSAAWQYC